ncbi:MAG TPA: ATP-binding protein [Candidatus Binatia bacterium]|nr:ATP-binding protein [Candidatus Binatia bacterium]
MSAFELISLANQVLFIGLFVAVLRHALRQPSRANLNTVLLFGSIATAVVTSRIAGSLAPGQSWVTSVLIVLLSVTPLAMLRLVDDFSGTPRWVQWAGTTAFVLVSALVILAFDPLAEVVELALIGWFGSIGGYAAFAFARAAARSHGITRRRMTAVAIGAVTFIAAIVVLLVGLLLQLPGLSAVGQVMALTAVIAFFLGFAPPTWVRRAWREPHLRRFLQGSIHLTGLTDERRAIVELEHAAAAALGASGASIGVADPENATLRYVDAAGAWVEAPEDAYVAGRAFIQQRRVVALDAVASDPEHADDYRQAGASMVIAAPITLGEKRLGVLTVYASRAPIFVEDDLWLLELLANQTAVILDARKLAAEASGLRSREDAARLKEEFLSAAAHDLRTPLTVVLGQAELLERRVARDPSAPVDPAGVSRIAREARRLRDLVSELLDAQRLEQGATVMDRTAADLRDVVGAVRQRFRDQGLDLKVIAPEEPIVSSVDTMRIEQVLDNLIENALKYTSDGKLPEVHLRHEGAEAHLAVVDHGVGIPEGEREQIFERFYRASNVQSITDTGMGLGLYICRAVVDAHGGRIWADATPGGGSTFSVVLPAPAPVPPVAAPASASASERWPVSGTEAPADA